MTTFTYEELRDFNIDNEPGLVDYIADILPEPEDEEASYGKVKWKRLIEEEGFDNSWEDFFSETGVITEEDVFKKYDTPFDMFWKKINKASA